MVLGLLGKEKMMHMKVNRIKKFNESSSFISSVPDIDKSYFLDILDLGYEISTVQNIYIDGDRILTKSTEKSIQSKLVTFVNFEYEDDKQIIDNNEIIHHVKDICDALSVIVTRFKSDKHELILRDFTAGYIRLIFKPLQNNNEYLLGELLSSILKDSSYVGNVIKSYEILPNENKVRFIISKTPNYKSSMIANHMNFYKFLRSIGDSTNRFYRENVNGYIDNTITSYSKDSRYVKYNEDSPEDENIIDFCLYPQE